MAAFHAIKQLLILVSLFLLLDSISVKAQITATPIQQLSFGTFYPGNGGGTVSISTEGVRTVTGDVITIHQNNAPEMPAIIEVQAPVGSRIAIVNTDAQLKGSNGGHMTLHINGSDSGSPYITTLPRTNISITGTLTIGNAATNPPGKYTGSFYITFMVE